MPLTDTQVKNAKPGKRPPIRLKSVRNGSDESSPTKKAAEKKTEPAKKYKTKSGEQPKSYKLYDAENLYIEVFLNGSKLWRFRFKFPKENVVSLGKYPKVSLAKAREDSDKCLELLSKGIDPSLHRKAMKNVQTILPDHVTKGVSSLGLPRQPFETAKPLKYLALLFEKAPQFMPSISLKAKDTIA